MGNPCSVAVVVDHKRSIAAGKVEIGCFRTYTNDYAEKNKVKYEDTTVEMDENTGHKDLSHHAHKYYKIPHTIFKSKVDDLVLKRVWN